ncbi:MAG: sensor protein, partial [Rhodospirillales bacterium]|nr:sensor protein [Rhodospirillales bacterium]
PDLPHIPVNAVELEQVVFNLVKNAIEAVAAAGPEGDDRRVRVRAGVTDDGAVEVAVADSGPGFAEGDAETAFAPFFTTKPGGIGMGLAICRAIIEGFGGDMSAANNADGGESGGGAVVSFRIPIEDQDHVT